MQDARLGEDLDLVLMVRDGVRALLDLAVEDRVAVLARLLETVRKGYWKADKKRVDQMLLQFNETIREAGLACNLNICNNEKLMQFISDRINDMPSLTTEEKSRYKSALDDLRHKAKTEDADADSTTDGGNDKIYELQIQDDKWLFKQK